jgi:hypothetical protein
MEHNSLKKLLCIRQEEIEILMYLNSGISKYIEKIERVINLWW